MKQKLVLRKIDFNVSVAVSGRDIFLFQLIGELGGRELLSFQRASNSIKAQNDLVKHE